MFSGIVAGVGTVVAMQPRPDGARMVINLGKLGRGLKAGDSVAVNGVCLTALLPKGVRCAFDVISETLRKTNLGALSKGSHVNIERSLRLDDRIEGHIVQGHVQAVGSVVKKLANGIDYKLTFRVPTRIRQYIAPLGSVAVNGVSLTVASVAKDSFTVALTPTTLALTNLGELELKWAVNVETDIMARQMVHWLWASSPK